MTVVEGLVGLVPRGKVVILEHARLVLPLVVVKVVRVVMMDVVESVVSVVQVRPVTSRPISV